MDIRQTLKCLGDMQKQYKVYKLFEWLFLIAFVILLSIMQLHPNLLLFLIVVAPLYYVFLHKSSKIQKQFQYTYKQVFAKSVLENQFSDVYCDWNVGYSEAAVDKIGLTKRGNRFHSEDYIRGTYEGIPFEQSDVVVKQVVKSGRTTHTYTYFEGRFFSFDLPKSEVASLAVFSKNFMYQGNCNEFRHEKVDMESEEFNRRFQVKATRPVDAFYILTPQMMEYISKLERTYGNVAMRCIGKKLHVAINMSGNAFDGNINKPIVYADEMHKMKQDCSVIMDIIQTCIKTMEI